jgi:hypothetical protein
MRLLSFTGLAGKHFLFHIGRFPVDKCSQLQIGSVCLLKPLD